MVQATESDSNVALTENDYQLIGQAILEHLQHESDYLDHVISCSLKMSELLKRSSYAEPIDINQGQFSNSGTEKGRIEEFSSLKGDLAERFKPVEAGRRAMQKSLSGLRTATEEATSLRDLSPNLEPSLREALNRLRVEVRTKLQDVQAIALGNQAVLLYTLDFYQRFMTGLTGESASSHAYDASGKLTNSTHNHLLEKQC